MTHCAPDAVDQDVVRFLRFFAGVFDVLRHEAEWRTQMPGRLPESFVTVLRIQGAPSSKSDKSSVRGNVNFPTVAKQMRCLFGSRGGAVRPCVLVDADMDSVLGGSE